MAAVAVLILLDGGVRARSAAGTVHEPSPGEPDTPHATPKSSRKRGRPRKAKQKAAEPESPAAPIVAPEEPAGAPAPIPEGAV